jgi:hypothetical protein
MYIYNYIIIYDYVYIYKYVYIYICENISEFGAMSHNMGMWHVANEFLLASKQESKFNLQKMDFTPMIGTSSEKTKKNLTELMEMSQQKHTPSKCHLCRFRTFWCKCRSHPPKSDHSPKSD